MSRDIALNEKIFLGCLLRSPAEFWSINDVVSSDMFSVPSLKTIFESIRDLAERGRQITTTALQALLPEDMGDDGPTIGILATLKENAMDAGSPSDYAEFIAENATTKRIAILGQWMTKESGKRSAEEVAAEASLRLNEIMAVSSPVRPKGIGEIATGVARHANSAHMGEFVSGMTTGISSLDEILGLMLPGDLGFIIASQGDGKSALAAQIGMHAALDRRPVLYIQMEMSQEQMGARELAKLSGISVSQIHEGAFDTFQWEQIVEAEKMLGPIPFHILDAEEMTVRQVRSQCLAMQRAGGIGMVVVDQLDKLKPEGKYRDRFEAYKEVTRDLKRMTKGIGIPGICLAQRTRTAQRRDDPTPHILDADIPSIERDADWVIGLWQKSNWLQMNKPDQRGGEDAKANWQSEIYKLKGVAEAITLKHRRRKSFQQCRMHFEGATMKFSEGR